MTDLEEEYADLLRQHADLEAEHERMKHGRYDKAAHSEHIRRLHDHSNRLHAYVQARFKAGPDAPKKQ